METLTSPAKVNELFDKAIKEKQESKRQLLTHHLSMNEDKVFEYGLQNKERFFTQIFQLASVDKTGRMAAIAKSLDLHVPTTKLTPECFICMATQTLAKGLPRLTKGLNLVSLFFYINMISMCPVAESTLKAEKLGNILKISSDLPQAELRETTEIYQLSSLKIFENELQFALEDLKNLQNFKPSAKPCASVEKTDDILKMIETAEKHNFNSVRMNHFEPDSQQNFVTALFKIRDKFQCFISFSQHRSKELLASSHFRTEPTNKIELQRYRNYADETFRTAANKSCLRHGGLKNIALYGRQISVSEPGLERCSQICAHQAKTHLFSKQLAKLTANIEILPMCHGYTYLPHNKTCYISRKMSEANFISDLSFKNQWESALTGEPQCLKSRKQSFLKLNKSLVNTQNICQFSHRDFTNSKLQTRCTAKYFAYTRPLTNIKEQLKYFKLQVLKLYEISIKTTFKRSITLTSVLAETVLKLLTNLALKSGTSLINNFINGIGLKTSDMLKQSLKKLEEAGFKGELITKEFPMQVNFTLFNYSLVSEAFSTLQLLSKQDKDINFDKIIFDLSQQYNELKNYYIALLTKPQPILSMTHLALKEKKYVFSSYIKDNQIFRHFFWAEMSNKNTAKFISTIPLEDSKFLNKNYYQTGIFKRNEKFNKNKCLIKILQNRNTSLDCRPNMEIYQNGNVIIGKHNAGFENVTILTIRGNNFVEIYCQGNTQIFFAKELKIVAIPNSCKIVINEQIFQDGTAKPSKFVIQILYEKNSRMSTKSKHNMNLFIILAAIFSCLGVGFVTVVVCSVYRKFQMKRESSSTYFQVTEQMPEVIEMIEPVERKEIFKKQMTKL